jgi:ADP-heptose:LPS heptosyltransferase/GT2 family glycosyltransferase
MTEPCFMLREKFVGGGGNIAVQPPITIQRNLAIGDVLCSTVVADKLAQQGHEVHFHAHPISHPLLRRCASVKGIGVPGGRPDLNLDGAYETDPDRVSRHFHEMFVARANQQLAHRGINLGPPTNCRPLLRLTDSERETARAKFVDHPRPWVFICPRSETYPGRQVPDATWEEIARQVVGTKFWLGLHPAPPGIVDLRCRSIETLTIWLSAADLLITVDTGPMHIGAALGVPIVAICQSSSPDLHLNDQNDYISVSTDLECLNCQKTLCPINPVVPPCQAVDVEQIIDWSNARLMGSMTESVSCVIPIYQPDAETLNRCLTQIIPQVQEVIVTRDQNGIVPKGTITHPKVSHVQAPKAGIGFGRNVNYGCRFTSGKYILILNDDAFLEPDCVSLLLKEMRPGVGLVSHLLRYPDGRIYHAGVWREPGQRDWGHIDHLAWHPTFKDVTELENCCGTSILVRRKMHFQIGGFDEDFGAFYSEDNDYAMRTRLHGWKILFTPHARGIHVGHLSTNKLGDVSAMIRKSNELFHRKWGAFLRYNLNNNMGTFDYLKSA